MIVFLTLIVFLLSTQIDHVTCSLDKLKGLKFSNAGYIMYSPNMTPFTNKITVCSWLRDQSSSSYPTAFSYGPVNRIRFEAAGYYNCIAEQCNLDVKSQLAAQVTKGDWFHACITWSTSSRSLRYYANGKLLGTRTTHSRTLSTGYKVVIGNHANELNSRYAFTGEMRNLNVYSKELTSEEIRRQAEAGICSLKQDENEDVRVLKWEDLIKLPRTGSVTELPISQQCSERIVALVSELNRTTTQLEETQRTLDDTRAQLNSTLEEKEGLAETLQETQENLNTTLEEKERLSETLQETQGNLNSTQLKLEKVSSNLTETTAELQVALDQIKSCNKTRWDWELFSQSEYFNKTISEEVAEQLSSSWDDIAERIIGFNMTEKFISFWEHVDKFSDERPWSVLTTKRYLNKIFTREMADTLSTMWDGISEKLVGITMTEKLIDLLKYIERRL